MPTHFHAHAVTGIAALSFALMTFPALGQAQGRLPFANPEAGGPYVESYSRDGVFLSVVIGNTTADQRFHCVAIGDGTTTTATGGGYGDPGTTTVVVLLPSETDAFPECYLVER